MTEQLHQHFVSLNHLLRTLKIHANERTFLVTAILMCLTDDSFKQNYPNLVTPRELLTRIQQLLMLYMTQSGISCQLREIITQSYKFLDIQQKLLEDRNLYDFVAEVHKLYAVIGGGQHQDIIGQMYVELSKTANNDSGLGIVLTPAHIADLMVTLVDVQPQDIVYDNCAGTGSLLISALNRMTAGTASTQTLELDAKRHIYGIEIQPNIAALLWSNMFMHCDGITNTIFGDCFNDGNIHYIQNKGATVGLLNPPFSTDDKHELEFVINNLSSLAPNGRCAAILPMNCVLNDNSNYRLRDELLSNHTLEAVISLPDELFFDSKVNTVVCLVLFTAHVPHIAGKTTWFGYYKDDGFIKQKPFGRVDVHDRWGSIRERLCNSYRGRVTREGVSIFASVTAGDEWCAEAHLDTDYSNLAKQCADEIKRYIKFRICRLVDLGNSIPALPVLSAVPYVLSDEPDGWGMFTLGDMFTVSGSCTTPVKRLKKIGSGGYPYVTCRAADNATSGWYDHWTEEGGVLAVDSAVAGHATYQPDNFSASDHVEKLSPDFVMNPLVALFFVAVQNLNKWRYSYGRKASQQRLRSQPVRLPVDSNGSIDFDWITDFMRGLSYSDGVVRGNIC